MKRSKFSLSNYKLLTCDMGKLVPVGLTEVLPGDTIQQSTNALIRVSPLVAPVMHPVHVRIHHWFVPHRIVWNDWENFITGGPDGMNASTFPTITVNTGSGYAVGSLGDYLGLPTGVDDFAASALPFRGYATIYNEYYRDQDLVTALTVDKTDGADTTTNTTLQSIAWEKDYYTSARPWTQKGPEITLPLGTDAPVKGIGKINANWSETPQDVYETDGTYPDSYSVNAGINPAGADTQWLVRGSVQHLGAYYPDIRADLSEATAATINELREAFALQRYEEARARYGSRYTEYLRYLGVRSSDARLQRPEYLGGGKQTIQFSEVVATAESEVDSEITNVGALKGHGIGALRSNRYRRFFEEHGYIFTLLSVRPKTIYAQGIPRTWNRRSKEDFWQKELQHIGQQEVLYKELYAAHATPEGTFGYQDRYDEYRRTESTIAGEFRNTLNFWHMARIFSSDPALNASFVTSNPTDRIYAAPTTAGQLQIMVNHSIQARRLVAKMGSSHIF